MLLINVRFRFAGSRQSGRAARTELTTWPNARVSVSLCHVTKDGQIAGPRVDRTYCHTRALIRRKERGHRSESCARSKTSVLGAGG